MKLINNKKQLYQHFAKDTVMFAYHIGDLDDFYFNNCEWPSLVNNENNIIETALIYNGLSTPTVMLFGVTEKYIELLNMLIPILPDEFYCHFFKDYRGLMREHFHEKQLGTHLKMKFTSSNSLEFSGQEKNIIRLNKKHRNELTSLFDIAYPDNYFDNKMLETGKYLGYKHENKLVGVSGVHTCSNNYKIAVLGNITVHPDFRGRKIATILIAKLTEQLINEGKTVVLNVHSQNQSAIKSYQNIGFEIVREYEESIFTKAINA